MNIINKISELNINGYYDQSNGYVVIWFHNSTKDKSDVVAYLRNDMSWDVREIVSEKSTIYDEKEVVEVCHVRLGIFEIESQFDKIVRQMLNKILEGEKNMPESVIRMKEILDRNSYGLIFNGN